MTVLNTTCELHTQGLFFIHKILDFFNTETRKQMNVLSRHVLLNVLSRQKDGLSQSAASVTPLLLLLLLLLFIDRFYIALFSALKQTHRARM